MSRSTTYFSSSETLSYVRKVYAWLLGGILLTIAAAGVALNVGTPIYVTIEKQNVLVPPLVAAMVQHPLASSILFLGFVFLATVSRKMPAINGLAYFGTTIFSGFFIGPAIFAANLKASMSHTLSAHPVRDAGLLTAVAFTGLTAYVFGSKRDFSGLGAFLMTGLWVLIGAMILAIFVGSSALHLAISSVAVLLFAGFIVFDTWKVLNDCDKDDAIGDALNLYLDVLNIFLHLMRILSSTSSSSSKR